jgi:4-amino-4-deoxy-L-arabinose transferase-like glycosyltransferase
MYHFVRWVESDQIRRRRAHALAVAAYFTLGFMTKFVAALFLPMVCVAALIVRPNGIRQTLSSWRDWVWPVVLSAAAILPWFVYQIVQTGPDFWRIIFGQHVYDRFTASLDPAHLFPWHHYFTHTWREFGYAGLRWIGVAGLIALVVPALRGNWLTRVSVIWWLLPFVLMSFGTSKLYHYAYPFLAPLAIGAGAAAAWIMAIAFRPDRLPGGGRRRPAFPSVSVRAVRVLFWAGTAAMVLAAGTAYSGPVQIELGGLRLFSNSSVLRPAVAGALCWIAAGRVDLLVTVASVVAFEPTDPHDALFESGRQTPVLLSKPGYVSLGGSLPERSEPVMPDGKPAYDGSAGTVLPPGILISDSVAILLPGPFSRCVQPAVDAGAWRLPG